MKTIENALMRTEASFWMQKNGEWSRVLNFFFTSAISEAKALGATQLKVINTRYYANGRVATDSLQEAVAIDLKKLSYGWSMMAEPKGEKVASVEELFFLKGGIATADVQPVNLYFEEALCAVRNIRDMIGFMVVEKDYFDSGEYIPRKARYLFLQEPIDIEEAQKADWLPQMAKDYLRREIADYQFIHIPEDRILYPFKGEYTVISESLEYF